MTCFFLLNCFGWTKSDYNDLQRHRPNQKSDGSSTDPYFLPIKKRDQNTKIGQGNKINLAFGDFILLYILMFFKKSKIDMALGRFIRASIVHTIMTLPDKENIWTEKFDHNSGVKWYFKIYIFPEIRHVIHLIKEHKGKKEVKDCRIYFPGKDSHSDACFNTMKIKYENPDLLQAEIDFCIYLNTIHKKIMKKIFEFTGL